MFTIKRITDPRAARRVAASFDAPDNAIAYGAFKDGTVLGTAVFVTDTGGCVTFLQVDTGRRLDVELADGMARAAFSAQMRAGAKAARLGEAISPELRLALSKRGYRLEGAFPLESLFARKCAK